MPTQLEFEILPQPDDTTCGPTCLHGIYNYYADPISLGQVIEETGKLEGGGTLAVLLGCHALRRGYKATLYSYDLQVFDPTWFDLSAARMSEKLRQQLKVKSEERLAAATYAYLEFLQLGGKIRFMEMTADLIRSPLRKQRPILTGLSATYLYRCAREVECGNRMIYDDIHGEPSGHFVVLYGYHPATRSVTLADPLNPNPMSDDQYYEVKLNRLVPSIMLGTLTFDANLLVISPQKQQSLPR